MSQRNSPKSADITDPRIEPSPALCAFSLAGKVGAMFDQLRQEQRRQSDAIGREHREGYDSERAATKAISGRLG
jgi:hypothetical protein